MDTIVALSTASGRSAIGVIRVSGPDSLAITRSLVGDPHLDLQPNHVVLRSLKPAGHSQMLDHALVTFFKGPDSYTGEDLVEISCHGSPIILRIVIDLILDLGGRLAEPGEFTLRALSHGKLNLSQAVAVRDLISARTDAAAKQAVRQLNGELSVLLKRMKDRLIQIIVILESAIEFVEDDLPEVEKVTISSGLVEVAKDLAELSATFEVGHLLRDGLRVTIVGRPNVGKSSLFNRLVASDRAIVTEIPGTTRDSITESISLGGIPIVLTDTAGMRESCDTIERIGVARSRQAIADADLALFVLDGSMETSQEDHVLLAELQEVQHLIVRNKSDLKSFRSCPDHLDPSEKAIDVSALSSYGIDELRAAIISSFGLLDPVDSGLLITDARQHDLLRRAVSELESSRQLLDQGASEELIVLGLHNGLSFLGEITGETTTEQILSEIFATFCIGK